MRKTRPQTLIKEYGQFAPLSLNEAAALANRVFAGAPPSREEAQVLLEACALFGTHERGWHHIVIDLTARALMAQDAPGKLQPGAEDWLIATLASTKGMNDETTLELIRAIMQTANNASERLGRFGLRAALASLKAAAPRYALNKAVTA